jgi:hypothetical protein
MICERCGNSYSSIIGSGRFCSRACSNKRVHTQEVKLKIAQSLSKTTKGKTRKGHQITDATKKKISDTHAKRRSIRLQKILTETGLVKGQTLKYLLLEAGLKENICEVCGQSAIWNDLPLTLELDHIDGNRMNNSLDNLRIICLNCHSQTDTFRWKNSKTIKPYTCSIKTMEL